MKPILNIGGFTGGDGVRFLGEASEVDVASVYCDSGPPLLDRFVPRNAHHSARIGGMEFLIATVFRMANLAQIADSIVPGVSINVIDMMLWPSAVMN